jgi:predicted neutral ceramidase superfamily lipid hydrolase
MLVYSGIFSASGLTHPIKSATTEPTISTGMSRAFSEIVRGHFSQALQYNPYSITIFIFFFSQLVMRLICTILLLSSYISEKLLIIADILLSVLLFLLTFYEFISDQFEHL